MMASGVRRLVLTAAVFASIVFVLWAVPRALKPTIPDEDESERDKNWINSSPNFFDRQACRWLGLCGITHIKWDAPALAGDGESMMEELSKLALGWSEAAVVPKTGESSWEVADLKKGKKREAIINGKIPDEVPDYVLLNAPLVHLYSGENFWPSDIADHVKHMLPVEGVDLLNTTEDLDLNNLGQLNAEKGPIFLTSEDDVESRPEWLHSRVGVPAPFDEDDEDTPGKGKKGHWGEHDRPQSPDGTTWWDADKQNPPHRIAKPKILSRNTRPSHRKQSFGSSSQRPMVWKPSSDSNKPDPSGYSTAPAVLVLVDKGSGIVDAFWFFFYSYNLGQTVLKIRFGNHVGDWEHCMIRFQDGIPRAMFLSEHAGGKAYTWHAMEKRAQKDGKPPRPVIYSAVGSHAMYANSGLHPYVLPFKILKDVTDKGPLWDPALNQYAYWYDYEVDHEEEEKVPRGEERTSLQPAASNPNAPTSWFHFDGYWGDDVYPLSDNRQWRLFGEYHYTTGPLGPKWKFLERRKVCQTEKCTIVDSIEAGKKSAWY